MRNILIAALSLPVSGLLSAQSPASLSQVHRAELEVRNTVHLLEQNIFLILSACVFLLGILLVAYVLKVSAQTNRNSQPPHSRSILFLFLGLGLYCSSCGTVQQVDTTDSALSLRSEHSTCPHHQVYQEPLALSSMYRMKGINQQRISSCRFCGQKMNRDQE
jgi:cytochrome c biogenesis factor